MESDATIMPFPQKDSIEENPNESNDESAVVKVKKLLFRRMLVGVNDGRFFLGNFHCLDKQGNIILQDSVEFRSVRRSSPSHMEQRGLGLILIPASCRTTCHIDCQADEQLSLLSPTPLAPPDDQFSGLSLRE